MSPGKRKTDAGGDTEEQPSKIQRRQRPQEGYTDAIKQTQVSSTHPPSASVTSPTPLQLTANDQRLEDEARERTIDESTERGSAIFDDAQDQEAISREETDGVAYAPDSTNIAPDEQPAVLRLYVRSDLTHSLVTTAVAVWESTKVFEKSFLADQTDSNRLFCLYNLADVQELARIASLMTDFLGYALRSSGYENTASRMDFLVMHGKYHLQAIQLKRLQEHIEQRPTLARGRSYIWPDLVDEIVAGPVTTADTLWVNVESTEGISRREYVAMANAFRINKGTLEDAEAAYTWFKDQVALLRESPVHLQVVGVGRTFRKSKFLMGVEALLAECNQDLLYLRLAAAVQRVPIDNESRGMLEERSAHAARLRSSKALARLVEEPVHGEPRFITVALSASKSQKLFFNMTASSEKPSAALESRPTLYTSPHSKCASPEIITVPAQNVSVSFPSTSLDRPESGQQIVTGGDVTSQDTSVLEADDSGAIPSEEEERVLEDQIMRLREEVLSGRHPRFKLPEPVVASLGAAAGY